MKWNNDEVVLSYNTKDKRVTTITYSLRRMTAIDEDYMVTICSTTKYLTLYIILIQRLSQAVNSSCSGRMKEVGIRKHCHNVF